MATLKKEFTSADLDANFKLVYYHGTGSIEYAPLLYDNTNTQRTTTDIFSFVDTNTIALELGNTITGTWTLYLQGLTDVGGGTVRKLHDLTLDASPTNDFRIAIGKSGTASKNIVLSAFYTLLDSVLNFCKRDGSNITAPADWRTDLDVYSTTEVDSAIEDNALVPWVRGTATLANVGQVFSDFIITFPDAGTTDYQILATVKSDETGIGFDGKGPIWATLKYTSNSFTVKITSSAGSSNSDYYIHYMIFKN
jgi:hypothetical protein